jgi:hypothetical protein
MVGKLALAENAEIIDPESFKERCSLLFEFNGLGHILND